MNIIQPEATIMWKTNEEALNDMKHLEMIGRVCYKSEDKITEDSYKKFLKMLIKQGHESVLEHISVTAHIVCDRGVSHELVRHRIGAFTQESTRYCNYKDNVLFIPSAVDPETEIGQEISTILITAYHRAEQNYKRLLELDMKPEDARAVLPIKLKTELFVTFNLRQWRHFLKLRTDKAAHPDMRFIAKKLNKRLHELYPEIIC